MNRLRQYQRGVLDPTIGLNGQGGGAVTTPITLPNTDSLRTYNLDGLGNWRKTDYVPVDGGPALSAMNSVFMNELRRPTWS